MNRYYKKKSWMLWMAIISLFTSCIYEDEVVCPCEVRFVYDYNMEFADAFPKQVDDVLLFIFDDEGKFLSLQEEEGEPLKNNYRMKLHLNPGTYKLVAWAGTRKDVSCYNLCQDLQPGISTLDDLMLKLNYTRDVHRKSLANLWHGMSDNFVVAAGEPACETVSLLKDVNRFKVLLQKEDGKALSADDYSFSIVADNHQFRYDNSLLPCCPISYLAYNKKEVLIENEAETGTRTAGDISAIVAEMGTMRLIDNKILHFIVRNEKEQKEILNINLVKYLGMMRLDQYSNMSLQEYLDREDTYQIILFLGKDAPAGSDVVVQININGWRLVLNPSVEL